LSGTQVYLLYYKEGVRKVVIRQLKEDGLLLLDD